MLTHLAKGDDMVQSLFDYCIETGRRELLDQWIIDDNLPDTPETVSAASKQKKWWRCEHGHKYYTIVYLRTKTDSGCPVCCGKQVIPGINDLQTMYPDLAAEWDFEKNGTLLPNAISPHSNRKVCWKCSRCENEWSATVASRAGANGKIKNGCAVCSNRAVEVGVNDLATTHPELAKQWHPTRNGDVRPQSVTYGTKRRIWWKCDQGHEYQARVTSRVDGTGCPFCTNRRVLSGYNDLATVFPKIAAQWHPKKNGSLRPEQVGAGSTRNVWWQCDLGHEWKARISNRTANKTDCPVCSNKIILVGFNDLATTHPKIAAQWHPARNGELTPQMVSFGSAKRVWWICQDGHEWEAPISRRAGAQASGCPICRQIRRSRKRDLVYESIINTGKRNP